MAQEPEPASLLPRPLLVVALGLTALLVVGVAAAGLVLGGRDDAADPSAVRTGPVALVPVPAPKAGSAECAALLGALPAQLLSGGVTLPRRELAAPAPAGALAWGDERHEPVVLRCGLDRPGDLTPTSQLRIISDVQWLEVSDGGSATWYVVDRPVYVALTVPSDAGTGPLQDVSTTIRDTLAKGPVDTKG
ncbi:DUF3515 domain-containing protein [Saccharothrix texasensis]|uniref:Uncharacterized protein DUF3515 n=1 Tax=Saccharothrix texasensis TaxID=103734 RepID=A0A3N1HDV0_9PSEU|nr:DUF3515 domain-containing protein [Saccharothrix texasensis]ROP40633.1 uncharacterized protein DUF3515 [Saccharothrix texasensis]